MSSAQPPLTPGAGVQSDHPIDLVVVAVMLAREHLPFVREWCQHHLRQGFRVHLYDNTGSTGSTRLTSSFRGGRHQREGRTKRGQEYGRWSEGLSDSEVRQALRSIVAELDHVTIEDWQPVDGLGRQVHGHVEAYVDYLKRHAKENRWAAFIDGDEYLHADQGCCWKELVASCGSSRILLKGVDYESRWTQGGEPRDLTSLRCCGAQSGGEKNLVHTLDVERADIHWMWRMSGGNRVAIPCRHQFCFRHYRQSVHTLKVAKNRPSPGSRPDESIPVG